MTTYDLTTAQGKTSACAVLSGGIVSADANPWWGQNTFGAAADNEAVPGNQTTRATILTALGCPSGSWLWKATLADVRTYLSSRGVDT